MINKEKELDWLYRLRSNIYVYMPEEWVIPMNNALDVAIKAVEQETVSREVYEHEYFLRKEFELKIYKLQRQLEEQALEQEPCEDAISRQAAKKALEDRFMELQKRHSEDKYETNFCLNTILELPSVTPQPKTEWVLCSERLPKIRFDLNSRISDTVFVCLENSTRHMAFYCDDGVWRFCESGEAKEPMWDKVIAWQPLPQSYKIESER